VPTEVVNLFEAGHDQSGTPLWPEAPATSDVARTDEAGRRDGRAGPDDPANVVRALGLLDTLAAVVAGC
jgi:hypothetical protein